MASKKKDVRIVIKLKSKESDHVYSEENRRNDPGRLELRKYDQILRRHVLYRETN